VSLLDVVLTGYGPQVGDLGVLGEGDEIIGPAVFLASSASDFMTGASLLFDGGWTA